jgi:hypothetical protein
MNPKYHHSKDGRTVVCLLTSKGEEFRGIARCSSNDPVKVELGEQLALARAELAIRKRDLEQIRLAKNTVFDTYADRETFPEYNCKLWIRWHQDACKMEKLQLEHIRNIKNQIRNLSNGIME